MCETSDKLLSIRPVFVHEVPLGRPHDEPGQILSFTNCNSVLATATVHFAMQSNSPKDMSLPPMTRRVDVAGLAPYNEKIQSFKRGH